MSLSDGQHPRPRAASLVAADRSAPPWTPAALPAPAARRWLTTIAEATAPALRTGPRRHTAAAEGWQRGCPEYYLG
jgi:hypothetical protein